MNEAKESAFSCRACHEVRCTPLLRQVPDYYLRTPFQVDYVRCEACGMVQQYPMPGNVGPFYAAYPVHANKSWLHERMRRIVLSDVYYDASKLSSGTTLLDYGCGDGWYLDSLGPYPLTRLGYEPDPAQARRVGEQVGVPVFSDSAAMCDAWKGKVDQIVLHFVLEHVTNLHTTFNVLSELLAPGGKIYAVVPNIASREFKLFGERWHGLDAPRHTLFPDDVALDAVVKKFPLSLQRSSYVRFPNTFAGSLAIRMRGHFTQPLFLLCLPLGMLWSLCDPSGNLSFEWKKDG